MLVIKRHVNQAVFIGSETMVMVTGIDRDGGVKIGIDAPRSIQIVRSEIAARHFGIERPFDDKEIFAKYRESDFVWVGSGT